MSETAYWWEAEAFAYYRVPKILFANPRYKELSAEASLLYGLLLDRTACPAEMPQRFPTKADASSSTIR